MAQMDLRRLTVQMGLMVQMDQIHQMVQTDLCCQLDRTVLTVLTDLMDRKHQTDQSHLGLTVLLYLADRSGLMAHLGLMVLMDRIRLTDQTVRWHQTGLMDPTHQMVQTDLTVRNHLDQTDR